MVISGFIKFYAKMCTVSSHRLITTERCSRKS